MKISPVKIAGHLRRLITKPGGTEPPASSKANPHNDEEQIIKSLLTNLGRVSGQCVDIAASDGITISNTVGLYRSGWSGLAVEGHPLAFARLAENYRHLPQVQLARCIVTPANVVQLLEGHGIKKDFSFLNLDIDSYDYFVLEALLGVFRPAIVCAEINEKIPPPIEFTVKFVPGHAWQGDHFYGQSIVTLHALARRFGYALVELHYNNAFLVAEELGSPVSLSAAAAYDQGYRLKADRQDKFPWNKDMDYLLSMDPKDAAQSLRERFEKYDGRYDLSVQA